MSRFRAASSHLENIMVRPELGTKCTCSGCGERFYDLTHAEALCPKCGEARMVRAPRVSRPVRKPSEAMRFAPRARPVADDPEAEPEAEVEAEEVEDADDVATLNPDAAEDDLEDDLDLEIVRPASTE
jgi:uncharacterized protein (TIGR02300 family)